jgi:Trk-type K+ transport system membrane component
MLLNGVPALEAAWQSVFLSATAFTNTGIVPMHNGLADYATDPYFLIVIMIAVVLGAIGFPVIFSLSKTLFRPRRWSLHVRLTLLVFGVLFVLGWLAILALEWDNAATIGEQDLSQKILQSAFVSANTRSGGFSTFDIGQMEESSLLVGDMLMFVGGGSASTAGGIKVTTLAILFLAALAEARGRSDMEAFRRRIPGDVLRLAVAVTLWGATVVAATTVTLLVITNASLEDVIFDAISAFATVGLSTGFTMEAPDSAQIVIAVAMFLGRIGTATFAAALAARQHAQLFTRPEERPIVG